MRSVHLGDLRPFGHLAAWLLFACWGMGLQVQGCSLALQWDDNDRPCQLSSDGNGYLCKENYSCLDNRCIGNGSQEKGKPCILDRQCKPGLICPLCLAGGSCAGANQCAEPCQGVQAYFKESACSAGYVCRPFVNALQYNLPDAEKTLVAACVPSENCANFSSEGRIAPGQSCQLKTSQSGGICMAISDNATACLPGCTLTFSLQTGTPNPNCDGTEVCALIGGPQKSGYREQQLACLYNRSIVPEKDDASCGSPFHKPCERPSTCVDGVCRKYCRLTQNIGEQSNCDANKRCCAFPYLTSSLATSIGFCLDVGAACPVN